MMFSVCGLWIIDLLPLKVLSRSLSLQQHAMESCPTGRACGASPDR